ncbi:MAG: UDP-N-acetylmuramoyl-tripeptide--D-alanyl-D-alanine ligase [Pseudoclavibacter caeni]|jgi:UDP-N-acetylmuramoyl-tripeptide--D-alanyl-D-alanine ligase
MITVSLDWIAAAVDGDLADPDTCGRQVTGAVCTDSRRIAAGDLFVALVGERVDGHDFLAAAAEAGASAALVMRRVADAPLPLVVVDDTTAALGRLARAVLDRARAEGALEHVIGITGSAGKTTTKRILGHLLEQVGETVYPQGSFNNEIGAPLTMLRTTLDTRFVVVEMGASHIGDLRYLSGIARPDLGVELQVGLAHVGEFGSVDNIRVAKQELVEALPADGVAVLNADDVNVRRMAEHTAASVTWFGEHPDADVRILRVDVDGEGLRVRLAVDGEELAARVALLGEHNAWNIAAATAAARRTGLSLETIRRGLESLPGGERWRMQVLHRSDGVTIVNDGYNASPGSMAAALRTLAGIKRAGHRTIAVLGAMGELGEASGPEHDRIGQDVVRLDIDQLVVVAPEARRIFLAAEQEGSWGGEAVYCETADEAHAWLAPRLREGDVVLVKSSNAAGLRFLGDRLYEDAAQ